MSTFTPYQRDMDNQSFTEPCMNCFASVTYQVSEAQDDPRHPGGKCIVCPCCGKLMTVNFTNIQLC